MRIATSMLRCFALASLCGLPVAVANAADYPARSVRVVVGAVAGGGVDITGRVVAAKLSAADGHDRRAGD